MFTVKGRLAAGVTMTQARQEMQQLATSLAQTYPDSNRNRELIVKTEFEAYRDLPGGGDTNLVVMLMTLALVVLAIACANVAGLLTSRAPARAREVALRLAVGAGRGRVVRQLMTESLLMAGGGGILGVLFGYLVISAFRTVEYPTDIPLKLTFELDNRALVVGHYGGGGQRGPVQPASGVARARTDLVSSLKDATATAGAKRSRLWGRSALVCGQVALSLVLLSVTVFMYRAFQSRLDQGPGFRTEGMIFASFDPALARYDEARTQTFYRELRDRALTLPGVMTVALASTVPMRTDNLQTTQVAPEGFQFAPGIESVNCPSAIVDEGYFDTTGIRIVQGRGFRPTDTENSPPSSSSTNGSPRTIGLARAPSVSGCRCEARTPGTVEIVGVAADSKYFFIVEPPVEFMYFAHAQSPLSRRSLMLATAGSAAALAEPLRALVRSIDPGMPVLGLRTMEDYYASRVIHVSRLLVGTVGGMGTIGVLLAIVGLYGLMAYAVSRRTREIGIRIAVGAAPGSVLSMVLRHGMLLAVVGIAVGIAGASLPAGSARRLPGTRARPGNDVTYVLVVPLLVAVTLLAAYIPARRAARTDPFRALRQDYNPQRCFKTSVTHGDRCAALPVSPPRHC